jgi:tryptophan synthase alpha chain
MFALEQTKLLAKHGVDFIELGMPYSDPMADGPVIQHCAEKALEAGITMAEYFKLAGKITAETGMPIVFMGYFNQILQYGVNHFIKDCTVHGISGCIVPDLPIEYYEKNYHTRFESAGLTISFLITPTSSPERIEKAIRLSTGFTYVVANNSITGDQQSVHMDQAAWLERAADLTKGHHTMVGFGIKDRATVEQAQRYTDGAIIGSAYLRKLTADPSGSFIPSFIQELCGLSANENTAS